MIKTRLKTEKYVYFPYSNILLLSVTTPTMCCPFCGTLMTVPVNYEKSYRQLQLELSTILSHLSIPQNLKMGIDQGMSEYGHIIINELQLLYPIIILVL